MFTDIWKNIKFDYKSGGSTPICFPHDTGRRQLPCWVIVAPSGGTVHVEISRHGKMSHGEGHAVLVPPNLPHRFWIESGNYISHWCHVRFTLEGQIDIAEFLDTPLLAIGPAAQKIRKIIRRLVLLHQQMPSLYTTVQILEQGFALLKIIGAISTEKPGPNLLSPDAARIRELVRFIEDHLPTALDRDQLARRCGLSPARFHVLFQQIVGYPPMIFVRRQRMQRAQFLLSQTSQSIKAIAGQVGYPDPYTFSRAFKNTIGTAPLEYRRFLRISPAY